MKIIVLLVTMAFFLGSLGVMGQTTYTLINSTTDLVAGDKYLIVSRNTAGAGFAAGYQNTNNRPQAAITVTAGLTISTTPATLNSQTTTPFEFTLGGSTGAWTLYDAVNNTFLRPRTGANNGLQGQATTTNATWQISFSSGAAVMTCENTTTYPRNILRYNSASGVELFACYASGQDAVYLYKASTIDTTSPTSSSFNPSDNATDIAINSNLVISFNENILKGTGNILIRRSSDNSIFETIDVTSTLVNVSTNTATINPTSDFLNSTGYYVEIPNTAFKDAANNVYAGISGATAWNFTTVAAPSFTVSFNNNGGTGTMVNQSANTATILSSNTFTRTGYTFANWNTAANGSGTTYANGASFPFTANTTLFAQWTPNFNITFANLQFPGTVTIIEGGSFTVFGEVYAAGLTDTGSPGLNITAEFAYSTSNTDPSTWTNWQVGTFNVDKTNNDEYKFIFSGLGIGTYYYATRFRYGTEPYVYGGFNGNTPTAGGIWNGGANYSGVLTVNPNVVEYANVQFPLGGTITEGADFNVYARVFKNGVTEAAGANPIIEAWIGYSTTNATQLSDFGTSWTWVSATYQAQYGNNDEYVANIAGASRPAGTYFYVSRFRVAGSTEFRYGGINNNFWTVPANSGVLTITKPTINTTATSLTGFTYVYGSGPATEQSFVVSGANLTANIILNAPTNYEISLTSGSGFTNTITLTQSSGSVANTTIYVRLKAGLAVANYNQTITATSTSAVDKTVALTGNVTRKPLTVSNAVAQNKGYDGNTTATITGATLVGVIGTDVVTVSGGGTFASANVGTGISVTAALTLGGAAAGNYTITQPTGLLADITAIAPTITATTINIVQGGSYTLPGANITSNSGGTFSYTLGNVSPAGSVTLSGNTLNGVAVGTAQVTINQLASGNYTGGSTTVTVNVNACTPPIWEENFDYGDCDVFDILSTDANLNWSPNSPTNYDDFKYNSVGLNFSGYPSAGIGGAIEYEATNDEDIKRKISDTGFLSGNIYMSFLINLNNSTSTTANYFATFMGESSSAFYGRIFSKKGTSNYQLGLNKFSSTTQFSSNLNFNTTYLVVVKYEIISGANNDNFKLWIFPSVIPNSEVAAGAPNVSALSSDTDFSLTNSNLIIKNILLRQDGTNGLLDGIRVATTWESLFCGSIPPVINYTWTGASSTEWSNAANWSPNGIPRSTDNITINTPGTNVLNIKTCRTINNFTLNGSGTFNMTATGVLTIEGNVTYGGTANAVLNCDSQVFIKSSATQIVPPLTYGNLDILGGNRVFSPTGIIKICGEFKVVPDPSTSIYTVTGSTVEYISPSGGFFMAPFTYNNLTFSGASNFILDDVTINVNGNFLQTAGTLRLGDNSSDATLNILGNATVSGTGKIDGFNGADILVDVQGNFLQAGSGEVLLHADDSNILNVSGNLSITENSYLDTYFGTATISVGGNFIQNGGLFFLSDENIATLNIEQNMLISGNAEIDLNYTAGGNGILNLKGDLTVSSTASLLANNANAAQYNFVGFGDGSTDATTQTIDCNNSTSAQRISFNVKSGSYVKLINQDFSLGTNSKFTIENGGTFDFGFNGTIPLNLVRVAGQTGQSFESQMGSALKITSTVGISNGSGTYTGNVQIGANTTSRVFSPDGIFHYIGKANQVTGSGLPIAASNKHVIVELDSDNLEFTSSNGIIRFNNPASAIGSIFKGLEIRKGTVIADDLGNRFDDGATGEEGNLKMSGGIYKIFTRNTQPAVNGNYDLSWGSKIIFAHTTVGSTDQGIRGGTAYQYPAIEIEGKDVRYSSTNINMKSNGLFTIKENAILTNTGNSGQIVSLDDVSPATLIVKNTGIFKTEKEKGFSGIPDGISPSPSVRTNHTSGNMLVVLETGSTIEYSRSGNQTITSQPNIAENTADVGDDNSNYSNLKLSRSGTKSFAGTSLKVGNDLEVAGTSLLPIEGTQTLIVNKKITTVPVNTILNSLPTLSTDTTQGILIKDSGSLVQIENPLTNENLGNIQMERKTKPVFRFDYTYWSSPVENFILKSVSPTTLFDKFFRWNETTQAWLMHSGNANPLHVMEEGRGYIVRAPQGFNTEVPLTGPAQVYTANFVGKPNNGTVTMTVEGLPEPSVVNKWNLLGNPYPSAIDATLFLNANPTLGGTLYFWTHNTSISNASPSYSPNDYASWNGTGATATLAGADGEINSTQPSGKIAAGQGFFVKGLANGVATFNNGMRIAGENNQFFKGFTAEENTTTTTPLQKHRVWLNLKGPVKGFNQLLVGYIENATNDFDNRFDGESFGGNLVTFYSINNTKNLVIQGRALPFINTDTVLLGYKTTLTGNLTISIDHVDGGMVGQDIYLQDNLLNVVHDLTESDYVFATVPGTFNSRFVLRYLPQENLSNPSFDDKVRSVTIYKNDAILHVNSPYENIATIAVYDLTGRLIFERKNCNTNRFETSELPSVNQALIVKVTLLNGAVVSEKVL